MITDIDKKNHTGNVRKVPREACIPFGSSLAQEKESRDIDIAVEGIAPKEFLDITEIFYLLCQSPWML